jgi:DNA-binding transcriptional regulator YiaG
MRRRLDSRHHEKVKKPPKVKEISRYARIDSVGRVARNSFEALRRELNLTQDQFGEKLGLSCQMVSMYEADLISPTVKKWMKIKDHASQHGIVLSDTLFEDFMKAKAKRMVEGIDARVQRTNDRIIQLNTIKETHGEDSNHC